MNILALDLASRTGWASLKGDRLASGVYKSEVTCAECPGRFFANYRGWLVDMMNWHGPQVIAFEMSHPHAGQAQLVAYGLISRVQEMAWRRNLVLRHVYPNTLKKFTTGNGRAEKPAMIAAMRKRWSLPDLRDDNEADALAVLAWAIGKDSGLKIQDLGLRQ